MNNKKVITVQEAIYTRGKRGNHYPMITIQGAALDWFCKIGDSVHVIVESDKITIERINYANPEPGG